MEEKSEFFSHLKGLRKEVFYNCVAILVSVIAYLVTYNFTNNIFAALAIVAATFAFATLATAAFAFAVTIASAVTIFTAFATIFAVAAGGVIASAVTVFTASATAFVATAFVATVFAAFAIIFAVATISVYRDTYKTTFYKPFILVFSQLIIFGASVLYPPAMIVLGVLYALAVIYFLVFDKKLITYLKANPPREKEVKPTIIIDTPYREVKINHHTIPPHPLYKWFYNQFMPSEKP